MGVGLRTEFTHRQGDLETWLTLHHLLAVNNYWSAGTFNSQESTAKWASHVLDWSSCWFNPVQEELSKKGDFRQQWIDFLFYNFISALFSKGFLWYSDTCLIKMFLTKISFFQASIWWNVGIAYWINSVSIKIKAHVCHRIIVSKNWERPKRSSSHLVSEICV